MLLTDIVTSSERVAAARKRLQKIGLLADCIRRLAPAEIEIEIGVSYLAGSLPQGRLGVGYTVGSGGTQNSGGGWASAYAARGRHRPHSALTDDRQGLSQRAARATQQPFFASHAR